MKNHYNPNFFYLLIGRIISTILLFFGITNPNQDVKAQENKLPYDDPKFNGKIGKTYKESEPDFPKMITPPSGAPNILLIMIDDIGFGQPSVFGGPSQTPNLEQLSKEGLIYNQFHTTALCSPTRAALLTGRNHHQAGSGVITEIAWGFPGYNSMIPRSTETVAEVLRLNGYNTTMFGKWHNTPDWETSPSGPFDRWPTGEGFEYFYGFLGGESSQWEPQLYENIMPVEPDKTPEQGYHLTTDLVDRAIAWMKLQKSISPEKPFFIYFATGAVHAPHHVPMEYIAKYKGKFDQGWDKVREETLEQEKKLGIVPDNTQLTRRPDEIPAWDSLSTDQKRLYAHQMEIFAGFVEQTDSEIGRLLKAVEETGQMDNTLIIYIVGDNGPSPEGTMTGTINNIATQNGFPDDVGTMLKVIDGIGGPKYENHYSVGWAWAGSAPFQWMKQVASHFGGTRNGLIIKWPKVISDRGGLRTQFHHVIDIVPTIYEAANITFPDYVNGIKQVPLAGVSMIYTFDNPNAPSNRTTQYFEMVGNRAIYHNGWIAAARHGVPWIMLGKKGDFENDKWELYNINEDFSEANDLADKYPEKLKELQQIFDQEAWKYNVYPLDDRAIERADLSVKPSFTYGKKQFIYYPGAIRITEASAPNTKNISHKITAKLELNGNSEGVIVAEGGVSAGYALYIQNNKLIYTYNFFGKAFYTITSNTNLPTGKVEVAFEFIADKEGSFATGGIGKLYINGNEVGQSRIEHTVPARFSATETFDVGEDTGSTVTTDYTGPFKFTGLIEKIIVDLK